MEKNRLQELMQGKSFGELNYLLNRYGGPSNVFLFEKAFPDIKQKDFEREIKHRLPYAAFEDALGE